MGRRCLRQLSTGTGPDHKSSAFRGTGYWPRWASVYCALLEMRRMISDEGIGGFLKIVFNVLRSTAARQRILAMRAAFKSHEDYLCAVGLVAVKPE